MILVVVNEHSKWIEANIVNLATTATTIQKLQAMFATHGLPQTVILEKGRPG